MLQGLAWQGAGWEAPRDPRNAIFDGVEHAPVGRATWVRGVASLRIGFRPATQPGKYLRRSSASLVMDPG